MNETITWITDGSLPDSDTTGRLVECEDPLPLPPVPCSALDEQRNALAEARLRIIARYEHVETWLKQPAPEQTLANWAGMVEGLRQARQIIGAMWDELPVPKPQAVIDHETRMRRVMDEQNIQGQPRRAVDVATGED